MTHFACAQPPTNHSFGPAPSTNGRLFRSPADLLRDVVAHVRDSSEEGELPLFVWSLGLPQMALARTLEAFQLPSATITNLNATSYEHIEQLTPNLFHDIRSALFRQRTKLMDEIHADFLSRALAGACFGNRQLWQDLGFLNEEAQDSFMHTFFFPLTQKHKNCRNWKRQLLKDLRNQATTEFSVSELLLKCILTRQ